MSADEDTRPLAAYMEFHGLDDEAMAAVLTERLGRPIKPGGVKRAKYARRMYKSWEEALALSSNRPEAGVDGASGQEPAAARASETPPTPPAGAKFLVVAGDLARERLQQSYGLVGAGVSSITGNPGYSAVVDDCAPAIAAAWLKAAEENDFARRVVTLMSAGGATGELVVTHVILLSGLLYVSGRSPLAVNPRWRKYAPQPAGGASDNGAAHEGAEHRVAEADFPPGL